MRIECNRREWLTSVSMSLAGIYLGRPLMSYTSTAPTAPVSIAKCPNYGELLMPTLETMFDQLGGLDKLVRGKTVAIKLNLTGNPNHRLAHLPLGDAQWVHPNVVAATVYLLGKAGARRIRLLESPMSTSEPLEEFMLAANWEPREFMSAASGVEFENTNYLGQAKKYSRFQVPRGGLLFSAYDLNHSYADCDVFVSLAKLKEHITAGITLTMKNCFGITPCTIYGEAAGVDEPTLTPKGGRRLFHDGFRQPSKCSPPEKDPSCSREGGYRVPRAVVDLVAARPIHLAIIDGIATMTSGEGPWVQNTRPVRPGVLIAGTNCVTTDAVGTAIMGYDPMADRGLPPFETCDSTLRLGEDMGLGTRDLRRIEVRGVSIEQARFNFKPYHNAPWNIEEPDVRC
ncbi:MAG: DUF362 domain-containing protein [Terriglobia bacterium]